MNIELLKKYAKLAVEMGVNLQENDTLCINSPIETSEFARFIAEAAYAVGAKDVIVNYNDSKLNKIRLSNSSVDTLSNLPEWFGETYNYYARNGACFISISASDPDAFSGVPIENIAAYSKARSIALKEYSEAATTNKVRWCVLSYPTLAWAKKVFPDANDDEALKKLGEAIISAVRINADDPVEVWNKHNANLAKNLDFMNNHNFKSLHLKSNNGTDLTVELPENHYWAGGEEADTKGILFNANMPTEEVFTLPKRTGVNGIVFSSKPLSYNGNLINDFSITFKDGKAVDFDAKEGKEVLSQLLDTDEGARYLGEIALVPFDSPISNSNLIFYNTLFDENAACHLAFGRAYPCIKNSQDLSEEQLKEIGVNDSLIHVDFMIGTADLEVTGYTNYGTEVSVFKNGNWAF